MCSYRPCARGGPRCRPVSLHWPSCTCVDRTWTGRDTSRAPERVRSSCPPMPSSVSATGRMSPCSWTAGPLSWAILLPRRSSGTPSSVRTSPHSSMRYVPRTPLRWPAHCPRSPPGAVRAVSTPQRANGVTASPGSLPPSRQRAGCQATGWSSCPPDTWAACSSPVRSRR